MFQCKRGNFETRNKSASAKAVSIRRRFTPFTNKSNKSASNVMSMGKLQVSFCPRGFLDIFAKDKYVLFTYYAFCTSSICEEPSHIR